MHALAVFLLLAPPAPARTPAPAPAPAEPDWGALGPSAAPADAPVDAVPTPARPEAAPTPSPPPVVQPPPPVAQPRPTPPPAKPARPDRPIRRRIDLKLEGGLTRLDSPKWYAASYRRHAGTFGAAVNLDFRPGGGKLFIGPTLGFRMWGDSDYVHDALYVSLRTRELLAGARIAISALEGVDVFVQARGGPVFVLQDAFSSGYFNNYDGSYSAFYTREARTVTGGGEALAGLSLYLPKKWLPRKGASRVTAGFETALGYAFRGAVQVHAQPDAADDAIPTQTANFGAIPLRGMVWHVGLFVRFM